MPIRIVYVTSRRPGTNVSKSMPDPLLVLTFDNWNDYGIRTMFGAYLLVGGEEFFLGDVRVMTSEDAPTSSILESGNDAPEGGKEFNFDPRLYLALGANLSFYERLKEKLPDKKPREELLLALHDVVVLEHRSPNSPDLALCRTDTFRISLLRDASEQKAYRSAREVLFGDEMIPDRFNFDLTVKNNRYAEPYTIRFDFVPEASRARPTSVAVLIGENGLGKTVTLVSLVCCLTHPQPESVPVLDRHSAEVNRVPKFRSVISVSYSPFETFPTNSSVDSRATSGIKYSYCGFRNADGKWGGFEYAWRVTFDRLMEIVEYERDAPHLNPGKPKYTHLVKVLTEGLEFDRILIRLLPEAAEIPPSLAKTVRVFESGERYVDLTHAVAENAGEAVNYLRVAATSEQLFFGKKDEEQIVERFSAGQAMFAFMVIGAIAAIDRESLLVIDEPELYLHPNLIISYLRMLTTLLDLFQSYAVVATHSAYVAREVPARSVRIFQKTDSNTISVDLPAIETFGADLIDITNLVFYNFSKSKPFEDWLKGLITDETDFEQLRKKYGSVLNIENLTVLRNALARKLRDDLKGERQ